MAIGKVKWFNAAKGYGFLTAEDNAQDIFVHYTAIQMDGYRQLEADEPVEFELVVGPKGPQAVNVVRLAK